MRRSYAMTPRKYADQGTHPNRLKAVRKEQGLSRLKAADLVGFHWVTVYRHETGQIRITESAAKKYATAYGVTRAELFCPPALLEPESEETDPAIRQ
jgi:transcriptional regulator with XRE-family HTH domain